jgi:2-octaprenyl-6-methoxyphenol hydroxylase
MNTRKPATEYDILIVGGGMVGASLAVALKPLGLKVGMIEAYQFGMDAQPSYDDRSIALSYGSSRIYAGMGLFNDLQNEITPIMDIHVSDKGHLGATRINASEEGVPALGYLVESRILGKNLYNALQDSDIDLVIPAKVTALMGDDNTMTVTISENEQQRNLSCQLLVAADGGNSTIRQLSGIQITKQDYGQVAIIANVTPEKPHNNEAFERFTPSGPIAMLPLSENRCSLVWTHRTEETEDTLSLNDDEFLQKLQKAFGYRLGRILKTGKRSSFPLALMRAERDIATRTVLIGNASHTLHPVAGQGLNLGLRDVAVLTDLIAEASKKQQDIGSPTMLQNYQEQRKDDYKTVITYTNSLVKLFSNNWFLLGHARAGGLMAVDRIKPLRRWLARQSMGINQQQSRLSRGLPV